MLVNSKTVKSLALGTALFASMTFTSAGTVAGFGGGTEVTQLLNNVQLVLQYGTQVQQYEAELKHLMKQQDAGMISPTQYINKLANIAEGGQALGVSSGRVATKLEAYYGNDYKKNAPYSGADYETWNKATKDSIRGAVRAAGASQDEFASESDMIMSLKGMSNSSQGSLQAQQAGNQIGLQMVTQLQKLRAMDAAQAQAMNARMLAVQNQEEKERADTGNFFGTNKKPMRSY